MSVRTLSFYALYGCRHSGACCTTGWPIPVEADRLEGLRTALAHRTLRMVEAAPGQLPFAAIPGSPAEAPVVLSTVGHRCVFFDDGGGGRCAIHRTLGHAALPLACRQFPRVVVHDPRGVSVTLSHFCPTAAAMLGRDAGVTITSAPAAFPPGGEYVGLDAREGLPPLVRPDTCMDWESWWEFERLSVDLLANTPVAAFVVLGQIAWAVEHVRAWRVEDEPLIARVRDAFARARTGMVVHAPPAAESDVRVGEVMDAIPPALRSDTGGPADPAATSRDARTIRHFLAAHAFANWTAHLGHGLRTWQRSLDAAYALIASGRDVRQADLLLRHLADPHRLADIWSQVEKGPYSAPMNG